MCTYDDMNVQPMSHITHCVCRTKSNLKNPKISNNVKHKILKILESTRFWLLIYLLINPVSGVPLLRTGHFFHQTTITSAPPQPFKGHPKVGIGIETVVSLGNELEKNLYSVVQLPIHFSELPPLSSVYNSFKLSKVSSDTYKNSLGRLKTSSTSSFHHQNIHPLFTSLEDSSRDVLGSQVPKQIGSSHLKPFSASQSVPISSVSSSSIPSLSSSFVSGSGSNLRRSNPSYMDETDNSHGERGRRATDSSPSGSGSGLWMKPCPSLGSALDKDATPKSLSTHILRAIHEANSQVEKFIDDFAFEAFQVRSWDESLPEFSEYSPLPFLNNSSGADITKLNFTDALQEAYELMQRRAVGIEQVTLDQALYAASFLTQFRHVEDRIVHILCELRHAMIQFDVTPKDITKDVMKEEYRDTDGERNRNIRDAIILGEYVNGLKLLHETFNNF